MYSFQPLVAAAPDWLGVILGSALFLMIIGLGATLVILLTRKCRWLIVGIAAAIWLSIVWLMYNSLVLSVDTTPPENERVVGAFVSYLPSGEVVGTKVKQYKHRLYVIYRVPEGDVVLIAREGLIYPNRAVLYRN